MAETEQKVAEIIESATRDTITAKLQQLYAPAGLEVYPFKIGWYNEQVDAGYSLSYHPDTLAYIVISTPDMFEKAFLPFICQDDCKGSMDLLDKCMRHYFGLASEAFPDKLVETVHDFDVTSSRRPKILIQVASHVAGATYYYSSRNMLPDPFQGKKILGVCIHPKFGGWFAMRGVIIFTSVQSPNLMPRQPVDCVPTHEKRVQLLNLFTNHWQDWSYRDIIDVEKRYSDDQIQYFTMLPKDRKLLITELRNKYRHELVYTKKENCHSEQEEHIEKDNREEVESSEAPMLR